MPFTIPLDLFWFFTINTKSIEITEMNGYWQSDILWYKARLLLVPPYMPNTFSFQELWAKILMISNYSYPLHHRNIVGLKYTYWHDINKGVGVHIAAFYIKSANRCIIDVLQ